MYKIRGKILDSKIETIENKKGGDPYKKMLITIEESNSDYLNKHQFELFGKDVIDIHKDKVKIDNFVTIDFYIKSNEWKDKFFVSLNVKDILVEEQATKLNEDLPF
jgi:hypothetical protein|tara:strand:- start:95 stop:412 length:318 start_codon:yes stop_codon:yes gene_type:complete